MDFVDWCDHVLNQVIAANASTEALSLGYLTDDSLASALFGEEISPQFIGSSQRTRLHTAVDELARNQLVTKEKIGQMYKIAATSLGRRLSEDMRPLWLEVLKAKLTPESESLLQLVNRLSQQSDVNMIWVEEVKRELLPQLGWDDKEKRMRAIRELEHYGFVRSYPPLGSELDLTATYRGLVWETRRAPEKTTEPEVAHVLFTDIVGYSKLSMDMQTRLRAELKNVVRATDTYRTAQARQKVIPRSTGDGIVLIFFGHPAAAVDCAIQISRALGNHAELELRMGAHTGPVRRDEDINDEMDVAGGGINLAQRVMDAGDTGHILVSKAVAENLEQLGGWAPYLHDLGEIEVKHGARIHILNLYSHDFGNPEPPASPRYVAESPTRTAPVSSSSQNNVRLTLIKEMEVNLDFLREIWNRVLGRVKFSPNHPLARAQKGDAIRALVLPAFKRDKWDRLLSEAVNALSKEEFEKVDRFYSRLEQLQDQRVGDPDKWRVEAELIISDLVAEGNPLQR